MEQQFEYPEGDVGGGLPERRFGRRSLLRGSLLLAGGLGAAALVGCGDDEEDAEEPAAGGTATATGTGTADGGDGGNGQASGAGRLVQDEDLPFPYEYPDPAGEPKQGGTFIHATNFTNTSPDPRTGSTGGSLMLFSPVYDKLLSFKMGVEADTTVVEIVPELANTWENTPDGLTYTFNLRDDVTWQNLEPVSGRAFTAEDVKYAFEALSAENSVQRQNFSAVSAVDVVDPHTLRVTLSEPLADFLIPIANRSTPIFPREIVEDGSIERQPIGTGAVILGEIVDQQSVRFDRNPDYWREMYVDGVELRILVDANARVAAFRAEQVDHAGNMVSSAREAQSVLDTNPDALVSMTRVFSGGFAFGMNAANPKFEDERVRQALSLGTDRDAMLQIVFEGYGRAHGLIPWTLAFDEEPSGEQLGPWMGYDPDEAVSMLQAAGAENLEINAVYYPYLTSWARMGELMVDQWRQIGVTLNNESLEYAAFTSLWVGRELEEATTSGWGPTAPSTDAYTYDQLNSQSAGNRWLISDPELDELTERQRTELDPDARRELVRQIYDIDMAKMYRIAMPGGNSYELMQPWVRGLRYGGALGTSTSVWDWADQLHIVWLDK